MVALSGCPNKSSPPPGIGTTNPTPVSWSEREVQAALRLRNHVLGQLENLDSASVDETLAQLDSRLSDDLFVVQNRAIAEQLAFEGIDAVREPGLYEVRRVRALQAIDVLKAAAPQSAVPGILRARIQARMGNKDAVRAALLTATKADPGSVAAWYELYVAWRDAVDPQLGDRRKELLAAGRKVAGLQPDNWFFWKDWIVDLARENDPDLKPLLERMRTELAPFAAVFERDVRVNPVKLIDNALALIEAGQAQRVATAVLPLRNILLLEARTDESAVSKHSLDFVVRDFQSSFPYPLLPTMEGGPTVSFRPLEVTLANPESFDTAPVHALQVVDFDLDGRNELIAVVGRRVLVLAQVDGRWTERWSYDLSADYHTLWCGDLDDDGDATATAPATPPANEPSHKADPDLVLSGPGGVLILENRWETDATRTLVARAENQPWGGLTDVSGTVLFDLDGDGDLDLFTAAPQPRCFIQRGNWVFAEITERSSLKLEGTPTAVIAVDWDRDVDLDLLVSTDAGCYWLENMRHGRLRARSLETGYAPLMAARQLAVTDFDGDGEWDLVGTGPRGTAVFFTQRSLKGSGPGTLRAVQTLPGQPCRWLTLADFDHNGGIDILTGGDSTQVYWNRLNGPFVADESFPRAAITAGVPADLDDDGDLDVWLGGPGLRAVDNNGGNARDWIELRLRAQQEKGGSLSNSKRVNHQGIGSLVELRSGGRYQAAIVEGQSVRFGLGTLRTPGQPSPPPEVIRILWTNGVPRALIDPPINGVLTEEQLPIGSCPYLYAWDGERFRFVTDLLWNAPLGLKFAEDAVAGWREWEHLKIDGKFLKPRDQEYVLQITEELWEIGYFDQVRLTAIDHPTNVQVFTNEKVGPAAIAEPKLHTVTKPIVPRAARRGDGASVLEDVRAADGRYATTAHGKLASGLFRENVLELDFGDLGDAKQVTLFLTGWLYPTDTSLNVQLSQHPTLPGPQPPSLWVPDESGTWKNVRPFLGFPGGKTKTIALDVSGTLNPRDARLRIVTNMEFAWDAAWMTVDEPVITIRELPLKLLRADLHHRGISQAVHRPGNAPEDYDYDIVVPGPSWPPLTGRLTRYGDVTPLLTGRDDQLAVFGAGDEMTVVFAVPEEPVPDGWVRDFVMHNVGWDKDAVLNTVHGSSVEPLPFEAMTVYGELRPLDDRYETYLRTYQTREQSPAAFWNRVRNGTGPVVPRVRP